VVSKNVMDSIKILNDASNTKLSNPLRKRKLSDCLIRFLRNNYQESGISTKNEPPFPLGKAAFEDRVTRKAPFLGNV
jgi:hypothetical protein